jgi:hypothetical protein
MVSWAWSLLSATHAGVHGVQVLGAQLGELNVTQHGLQIEPDVRLVAVSGPLLDVQLGGQPHVQPPP